MNNEPLISVIVPVYNVEKYLGQCLDSIINQTLKDIEIICVDDGSTDGSLDILNSYKEKDDRIIILKQKNLYAGVARNNGAKAAKGKYLSFLDSDDFFDVNMLQDMYNQAEKDKSDIVICGWKNYDNRTNKVIAIHNIDISIERKSPFSPESIKKDLFTFCKPNPWTKLFRNSWFKENNLQFENFISCNDLTCIYTALICSKKISIVNKPYVYYRANQSNNLTAKRNNHFDCFIGSVNKLKENMIKLNKFDTYKETFIKRMSGCMSWELSRCTEQQKQSYKTLIKDTLDKDVYNCLFCSNIPERKTINYKKKTKFF